MISEVMYGKDKTTKHKIDVTPNNEYYAEQIRKGNLMYLNKMKIHEMFGTTVRLAKRVSKTIEDLHPA